MSLLPTLSPSGWVSAPLETLDFMMAYFFETQPAQSHFHKGTVTSYQRIIADQTSIGQLKSDLESKMTDYLSTQFDDVKLSVEIKGANGDDDNNQLVIEIQCTFTADGKRIPIGYGIEMLGTQCKRIERLNETGVLT